jgi:NAD(P)-dependent dehydrogenase (short-subunit alcohol dehydrogenase family)
MALGGARGVFAGSDRRLGVRLPDVSSRPAVRLPPASTNLEVSGGRSWSWAPVNATVAKVDLGSFPQPGVAVVFGAGGGVGGALVEAIRAAERFEHVVALSRSTSPSIDLMDEASLERAAAFAADRGELRLVIDATGFLHDDRQGPEKTWRQLDAVKLARSFALNAIGPALIMKHVLPRLARSRKAVFATLSARVGSIGDNRLGGWYSYRASKAALNQLVRTAAVELAR